jgi:hypothetical protein
VVVAGHLDLLGGHKMIDVNQTICDCGTELEDEEVFQVELDYLLEPVWMCLHCLLGLDSTW